MKTLHIIRGHSGSGKSTLAKSLTPHVFEADDFFMNGDTYAFDPKLLTDAHNDCQRRTASAMKAWLTPICVANTFTRHWEVAPYLAMAKAHGYDVVVHICTGEYQNVHGVPAEIVAQQKERFEG